MSLRPITLLGIVISMVTGIALGIMGYRQWLQPGPGSDHARAFDALLTEVEANYVADVNRDQLARNAFKGMLHDLDPYSLYLEPGEFHELQADTTGRFGGIGVEIGLAEGYFTVIAPMHDTPAERAGLLAGDRIIELNGESLKGRRLVDVVEALRGEAGSELQLTVERNGETSEFNLTRATIEVASVHGRLLEPGYGYVRITQFQSGTGAAFESTVAQLREQSDGRLDGLLVDLRNNPGGVLQASVAVADALLEDGLIVYTEGRLPSSKRTYRATRGDVTGGAALVLLVNRGTASAAEIVAGAVQDHGRGRLLGSRSFGKGSVQSVMPLEGDQALKLTTAYYYTPGGRSIHESGIEPDLTHERGDESRADYDARLLDEGLAELKRGAAESLHARLPASP